MASQATQEMVRSSTRTQGAVANATCSTFTPTRITTSDTSTGIATLNAARGKRSSSSARATYASVSSNNGNITPSMRRRPNSTEVFSSCMRSARRSNHVMPKAIAMHRASAPSSVNTVGCVKADSQRPKSSMGFGAAVEVVAMKDDVALKDQERQLGARLSMKACTPSCATGCAMLQAMVWPASW